MRILGLDPGLAAVGWGFIVYPEGGPADVRWGAIRTSAGAPVPLRLQKIQLAVRDLVRELRPEAIAVEELFFATNVRTAIAVAQARGVLLLATVESGVEVFEYTPLQVKKSVSGRGRASKAQVQKMVAVLLGLRETPQPDHAADALATALCHGHSVKARRLTALDR